MTTLTVVIPAYNEEKGIADIMHRVLAVRPALHAAGIAGFELLVVNDGSKDRTGEIAEEIAAEDPEVRVIHHPQNRNYGGALKTGFAAAKGELVGFLDADGTYPPEYFPQLCEAALKGGDVVIGSRMAGEESKMPFVRRVGNFIFATLLSVLGWQKVTDSASGMRVFHKNVLEKLSPLPDGLNLTPVMSTRAIHEGMQVVEVPIPYSERVGRSKLSAIRDGSLFLTSIIWTVLAYNPVRPLGILGLLGVGLAGVVGLGLIIIRLSGVTTLGAWGVAALFAALLGGVVGISLFALGATFNYLVSLFYAQPIRQGLFGRPLFKRPLERRFGWMGMLAFMIGLVIAIVSLVIGIGSGELERLWLYLLGSALFILVGMQLMIYYVLIRVLQELSQREMLAGKDNGSE